MLEERDRRARAQQEEVDAGLPSTTALRGRGAIDQREDPRPWSGSRAPSDLCGELDRVFERKIEEDEVNGFGGEKRCSLIIVRDVVHSEPVPPESVGCDGTRRVETVDDEDARHPAA